VGFLYRMLGVMGGVGLLLAVGFAVYALMGSGDDSRAGSKPPRPGRESAGEDTQERERNRHVPVKVAQIKAGPVQEQIHQNATLVSANRAPVFSTAAGIVKSVTPEEGDSVAAGQVLVQLDDEEWRLNLAQARVTLARDQREWARQQSIAARALQERKEYREARFAFETKKLALEQRAQERLRQESEARRMEVSFQENLASEQERDQSRSAAELSRIAERQARLEWGKAREDWERVQALDDQSLEDQPAYTQAEFAFKAARAAVAQAEHKVRRAAVTAPISGVVVKREVEPGDYVTSNSPLLTLADLDALEAMIHLPELHWNAVRAGQRVTVRPETIPGLAVTGSVSRVSPTIDAATGTFKVTVSLETDAERRVRPGMFVALTLHTAIRKGAFMVPRTAVLGDQETRYVMVVDEGTEGLQAQRRVVRLGVTQEDMVEVREGLAGGEQVVVVGQHSLKAGAHVRIEP